MGAKQREKDRQSAVEDAIDHNTHCPTGASYDEVTNRLEIGWIIKFIRYAVNSVKEQERGREIV